MDPPPVTAPEDPERRKLQFYLLILRDGDTIIQQPTIRPFEGTSFTFTNLTEGTTYSLEVNALVGDAFDFFDLDLEPQFISTLSDITSTQTPTTDSSTATETVSVTTGIYATTPDTVTTEDPYSVTAEIKFDNVTRSSFRAAFFDPPPQIDEPLGRQILFYVLALYEEGESVETVTIGATEGAYYDFLDLKPGTNYSIEVNFLVGLPDGSQTELILPDLPPQFVSTLAATDVLSAEITFDNVTRDAFRAVFLDPPPNFEDPSGRQVLFYVLALHEEGVVIDTITINATEGAYYNFVDLKPGTNYSVQVNFLVGLSDGSQIELILSDLPHQLVTTSMTTACQEDEFTCLDNGQCIMSSYVCDTVMDCSDGSDEMDCPTATCPPGEILCDVITECIFEAWLCDGNLDCLDGTDEDGCPTTASPAEATCAPGEFLCNVITECIFEAWLCDGNLDCLDGTDEDGCPTTASPAEATCPPGEVLCDVTECIFESWLCDGNLDCSDGTDEAGCPTTASPAEAFTCAPTEFLCTSGSNQCISGNLTCDGFDDCNDGSDEVGCPVRTCPPGDSPCDDSVCIPDDWFCDGFIDCADNSDESCSEAFTCAPTEFLCTSGDQCISGDVACDGFDDCNDGTDEVGCPVTCPPDHTMCDADSCILEAWLCDGALDCTDGTDEVGCPTTSMPLPPP